eukprot:gene6431-biopygen13674
MTHLRTRRVKVAPTQVPLPSSVWDEEPPSLLRCFRLPTNECTQACEANMMYRNCQFALELLSFAWCYMVLFL